MPKFITVLSSASISARVGGGQSDYSALVRGNFPFLSVFTLYGLLKDDVQQIQVKRK
jgi:hypothetical protein